MDIDILAGKIMLTVSLIVWVMYWGVDFYQASKKRRIPRANIRRVF